MKIIKEFKDTPINGEIITKMEEAAININGLEEEDDYFMVFIMNQDILEQIFALMEEEKPLKAPLFVCGFSNMMKRDGLHHGLLALSRMMEVAEENDCSVQFNGGIRLIYNDDNYKELSIACGVPENYACFGGFFVGEEGQSIEIKKEPTIFSYIK